MSVQREFKLRKKEQFVEEWDFWLDQINTGLEKLKELVLEAFDELNE